MFQLTGTILFCGLQLVYQREKKNPATPKQVLILFISKLYFHFKTLAKEHFHLKVLAMKYKHVLV